MSNHNYSQYSNKRHDAKGGVTAAPVANKNNNQHHNQNKPKPVVNTPEVVRPVMVQETVETVSLPKTVEGVVAGCAKLNVRAEPSLFAEIVCVLDASSEMAIDVENSDKDWFKICTATGIEGYCMRKFVEACL